MARLGEALRECEEGGESQSTVNLIRLLLLTGCRLNEILTLKWEHVDLENGALHLRDSKTGDFFLPGPAGSLQYHAVSN